MISRRRDRTEEPSNNELPPVGSEMTSWRTVRVSASRMSRARIVRVAIAVLLVLALFPITWALAFPEPNDRRLCPPDRKPPPRLTSESSFAPDPEPGSPVVRILNPIRASTPAKMSDKYDGFDRRFHINAIGRGLPSEAVLEAYALTDQSTEVVLGTLCPVPETRDTFDGFWDIPETFREGFADLRIKAFDRAGEGAQVLATDQVRVDVQHRDGGTSPASANVTILWPVNDGPLGFFRNKAGEWKANIQGIGSPGTSGFSVRYSTTPLGGEPRFTDCDPASPPVTTRASDQARQFDFPCRLRAGDRPSAVTAIAAVAQNGSDSSAVHRVHPFIQQTADMKVTLSSIAPATQTSAEWAERPSGRRRGAGKGCLTFEAFVRDQFGRPVYGANVDVQLRGPSDAASFGADTADAAAPDKVATTENGVACSPPGTPSTTFRQGRSVVADGPDVKAIESGSVGTNDAGKWRFTFFSGEPGVATVTAWVDDEPLVSDTSDRPTDNDRADPHEPSGTLNAEWLESPITLDISPDKQSSSVGSCRIYKLSVVSGTSAITDFNIDVHVRTPDTEVRLCGEGSASLRPPDSAHADGPLHQASTSTLDAQCPALDFSTPGPPCHHLEGTTDEDGELIFGMSSALTGTMRIRAWADGEPDQDSDEPASKVSVNLETKWLAEQGDSSIKLLTPATDFRRVSTDSYTIVARVGAPYLVQSVSIELSGSPGSFYLGDARRIGNSSVYEFVWDLNRDLKVAAPAAGPEPSGSPTAGPTPSPTGASTPSPTPSSSSPGPLPIGDTSRPGVPDGTYTITARVNRSAPLDTSDIEVNRSLSPQANDTSGPFEWAQLSTPKNGAALGFVGRATTLTGLASQGAEAVDLLYTTSGVSENPIWKRCGYVAFASPTAARLFSGECRLGGTDEASDVTGVGAIAFNCAVPVPATGSFSGCSHPSPSPLAPGVAHPSRETMQGSRGTGMAVAVTGCEGSPCLVLMPMDWQGPTETCVPFSVLVAAQNQPSVRRRVAADYRGPTDRVRFCDPDNELGDDSWLREEIVVVDPYGPDLHRTTGETDKAGEFRFGVVSSDSTFKDIFSRSEDAASAVTVWLDDGDAVREPGEGVAEARVHWELPGRCTVIGTRASEVIVGTIGDDKICGLEGNDKIFGLDGNDVVLGGDGADTIYGEEGEDLLFGEASDDSLFGGPGRDQLDGGTGTDHCDPGSERMQVVTACETVASKKGRKARAAAGAV